MDSERRIDEKNNRLPTLEDYKEIEFKMANTKQHNKVNIYNFNHFVRLNKDIERRRIKKDFRSWYNYFVLSILVSFLLGLLIGVVFMRSNQTIENPALNRVKTNATVKEGLTRTLNSIVETDTSKDLNAKLGTKSDLFTSVSFTGHKNALNNEKYNKNIYPKGMSEDMKDILKDNSEMERKHKIKIVLNDTLNFKEDSNTVLFDSIYWGKKVEDAIPLGYNDIATDIWDRYISQTEVVKMEPGCGRMQNRLVTFVDGLQACVRYRQNTDQIQGEVFSFYVGKLLNLTNLAPSVVRIVDVKADLWKNVANDIAAAQWNSNRAVVLTQYIPSLESANIPEIFKPTNRHLNKFDVLNISTKENGTLSETNILLDKLKMKKLGQVKEEKKFEHIQMNLTEKTIKYLIELAQWSDLIIFDFLTANLDRIVNNLFNFQWNVNIMDGPAHNLARKSDNGLLMFLDNESGLLHGYRLLKKYNVYHSLMLENLCVFRKSTIDKLKNIDVNKDVGEKLSVMFHSKNDAIIRDVLPPLPSKNAKILQDRIAKVLSQVEKCEIKFSDR